jgi:hypothetical protein
MDKPPQMITRTIDVDPTFYFNGRFSSTFIVTADALSVINAVLRQVINNIKGKEDFINDTLIITVRFKEEHQEELSLVFCIEFIWNHGPSNEYIKVSGNISLNDEKNMFRPGVISFPPVAKLYEKLLAEINRAIDEKIKECQGDFAAEIIKSK